MILALKFIAAHRIARTAVVAIASSLLAASALASTSVTYTGAAASANFGSQSIPSASAARALTFSVAAGTKVGSIAVLTTGIANMDFANAGGTCAAQTYSSTTSCTVNVTFKPQSAGARMGAVVFFSAAANKGAVLGSASLSGTGNGAQIAYGGGAVSAIDPATIFNRAGLQSPGAMAVDAAGNLFILDAMMSPVGYRIVEVPASGAAPITMQPVVNGEGLYLPSCIAVDGAGNLFIGDFLRRIIEIPVGGGAATVIAPTVNGVALSVPSGLAVDGAGNLYISDFLDNRVLEVPANGGAAIAIDPTVNGLSLNDPHGLAVNAAGDLYIADLANARLVIVPASGSAATALQPEVNGQVLRNPIDVAVDAAGDLFVADNVNHRIVKLASTGDPIEAIDPTSCISGMGEVYAVRVDGGGNLFIVQARVEGGPHYAEEIHSATVPTVGFSTPTSVNSVDTVDGTQTIQIVNIGNQALTMTALSFPADFAQVDGDENACTVSTSLKPGQSCDLNVQLAPQKAGALKETIELTDNAVATAGGQQAVVLTGTSESPAEMITPAATGTLTGSSVTFTWSAGTGATGYYLSVGNTGVGSNNIYNSGKRTVTTWTATGLPTNGSTLYVRLTTYFGSITMHKDYVYTAK
jgi:sugar lactone lactonase YvrE